MALLNVFQAQSPHKCWHQVGETGKERVSIGTQFFVAVGGLPVDLIAYQVSIISVALYTSCYIWVE